MTAYEFAFRQQGYSGARSLAFYRDLLAAVATAPGAASVAVAEGTPMVMGGGVHRRVFLPGDPERTPLRMQTVQVSDAFFITLGIDVRSGRRFTVDETMQPGVEREAIVSESLARRLFGEPAAAVGRVLTFAASASHPDRDVEIVSVAEDVRWDSLIEAPPEVIYRPLRSIDGSNDLLLVRSSADPGIVIPYVRDRIRRIDPLLHVLPIVMADVVSMRLAAEHTFAWALALLAAIAFLLAAVGIHGLVSQAVVERTREFGVRLALGADRARIARLVLRSAFVVMAVGAPLGIAMAAGLSRVVRSRLYGVAPGDPWIYGAGVAALLPVVLAASVAPAWVASRANPADVLRAT